MDISVSVRSSRVLSAWDRLRSLVLNAKWRITGLARAIERVDRHVLVKEYENLLQVAPRRHDRGRLYFVPGHDGRLPGHTASSRFEEHLAMAIWRFPDRQRPRPGGGWFPFLDYQFPLKDAQANPGVGKVLAERCRPSHSRVWKSSSTRLESDPTGERATRAPRKGDPGALCLLWAQRGTAASGTRRRKAGRHVHRATDGNRWKKR